MLKREIEYVDFNGEKKTGTFYFNISEPELIRLDVEFAGGLETYIESLDADSNPKDILTLFERVIRMAYGSKDDSGFKFVKTEADTNSFIQSAAYNALFVELLSDANQAIDFFNGLVPKVNK